MASVDNDDGDNKKVEDAFPLTYYSKMASTITCILTLKDAFVSFMTSDDLLFLVIRNV